ncbi:hypothetical protein AURDEDRAFT_177254 [Auricularia subglabra TFB-10046 SS5]|uniref:Uncharacterized protein n=1 Tax=Auricularia subglabra (strain TFB-10046 / SS5) TaxID=717982 RepID=J0CTL5_AURST|nr:hypothetical protein AURDEDRAFT_177254 [Auricularia subglabra TFB-10046 SS5]
MPTRSALADFDFLASVFVSLPPAMQFEPRGFAVPTPISWLARPRDAVEPVQRAAGSLSAVPVAAHLTGTRSQCIGNAVRDADLAHVGGTAVTLCGTAPLAGSGASRPALRTLHTSWMRPARSGVAYDSRDARAPRGVVSDIRQLSSRLTCSGGRLAATVQQPWLSLARRRPLNRKAALSRHATPFFAPALPSDFSHPKSALSLSGDRLPSRSRSVNSGLHANAFPIADPTPFLSPRAFLSRPRKPNCAEKLLGATASCEAAIDVAWPKSRLPPSAEQRRADFFASHLQFALRAPIDGLRFGLLASCLPIATVDPLSAAGDRRFCRLDCKTGFLGDSADEVFGIAVGDDPTH